MPRPRAPLPPFPPTFSVRAALGAGASRGALRHPAYAKPHYGVRSTVNESPLTESLRAQMLAASTLLLLRLRPGEAVSHSSALLLHGCPIYVRPDLHVSAQPENSRGRTRGVHGHRLSKATPITRVEGVPLVFPTTALLQSAAQLSLLELVVATDHLIRTRGPGGRTPPQVARKNLDNAVERFGGRGARNLRLALTLSRVGAESRMETLTRLLLYAFGLESSFELQSELSDNDGWIGRFDLVDHRRRVIVEYDGDQHRTSKSQYEKDLRRLDRARAAGYHVIRLLSGDILHRPHATAARIAFALGTRPNLQPLHALLLARPGSHHLNGERSQ